ncbi:MAG: helix-turn-helix transcriptional regulator [Bacteroidaceae bacterium]|nr:helix-turn-helix transcriptional regulator [Bacteroidaceae bacterium]
MDWEAIYYIPFIICLVALALSCGNDRVECAGKKIVCFILLLILTGIDAVLSCNPPDDLFHIIIGIAELAIAPLLVPWAISITERDQRYGKPERNHINMWIPFSVFLALIQLLLVIFIGKGDFIQFTYQRYNDLSIQEWSSFTDLRIEFKLVYIISVILPRIIIAMQLVFFVIRALYKRKDKDPVQLTWILVMCCTMYLVRLFFHKAPASTLEYIASLAFSLLLSFFLILLSRWFLFEETSITTDDEDYPEGYSVMTAQPVISEPKTDVTPITYQKTESEGQTGIKSNPTTILSEIATVGKDDVSYEEDSLRSRFEALMKNELFFLRQGLKVTDVASVLKTNRTYISRLVNNTFNMSFSDYVNTLRVDYAEQYLLHHGNANQTEVAQACGFPNASSFNSIFSKITGMTPKAWYKEHSGQKKIEKTDKNNT